MRTLFNVLAVLALAVVLSGAYGQSTAQQRRTDAEEAYHVAKAEYDAARKLKLARQMAKDAKEEAKENPREAEYLRVRAEAAYREVVKSFPGTQAAADAKELLAGKQVPERPMPPNSDNAGSAQKPANPDQTPKKSGTPTRVAKPETDEEKMGAAAYDVFIEPWRSRFTRDWEEEVESLKKGLKDWKTRYNNASIAGNVAEARRILSQARTDQKVLRIREKNDPPYINGRCRFAPAEWQVGDYGYSGYTPRIIQVIPPDRVLLGNDAGPQVMLKVSSTDGLIDDRDFKFGNGFIHVTGTTTYRTVIGGTKTVLAADLLNLDSLKGPVAAKAKPLNANEAQFVGRWRIVDNRGVTATFFTLTSSFEATKSHAPGVTGKWEVVGEEARITWSDGWRDILRPQKDRTLKIAFGPGTNWDDTPANTQRAIKEPQK